ncbi:MAG: BREX-6 system BrxE protein [Myxococcales bacterium]|nr:BREX-6 system BrxE protein [Myxococcales bacterium]
MDASKLDAILELQLIAAWAGEAISDPPRLGWWRTGMVDEFGGEDLLRRLAPNTWRWSVFEAARAAARRVDDAARSSSEDADHLISLFRLGFDLDEKLDDRLRELKHLGKPPAEVFPELAKRTSAWDPGAFDAWLAQRGEASYTNTATGRRLKGERPDDAAEAAAQLAAALRPLSERYPLPHYRVNR